MSAYLFSCEHANCAVPEAYRELFRGSEEVVGSEEGWEPGSLNLAQAFSMKFRTPLVHGDVTRLLIDLEKDGDARWSRFSMRLPEATRAKVADRHERPFRASLLQRIAEDLRRHAVVLLMDGVHHLVDPPVAAHHQQLLVGLWLAFLRLLQPPLSVPKESARLVDRAPGANVVELLGQLVLQPLLLLPPGQVGLLLLLAGSLDALQTAQLSGQMVTSERPHLWDDG